MSSGVPWKTRMKTIIALRATWLCAVRSSATISPPMPPPTKAMIARMIVQRAAKTRSSNSFHPNCRIIRSFLSATERVAKGRPLDRREQSGEDCGYHQVHRRDHDIGLEAREGLRIDIVACGGKVGRRDHRNDARGQQQEDELAGQRRIDGSERWLENDVAKDLHALEAERDPGLHLPPVDRLDARADDLGAVCAHVDCERHQRRGVRIERNADGGEAEIDEEDLDEERRVADHLDI